MPPYCWSVSSFDVCERFIWKDIASWEIVFLQFRLRGMRGGATSPQRDSLALTDTNERKRLLLPQHKRAEETSGFCFFAAELWLGLGMDGAAYKDRPVGSGCPLLAFLLSES